MSSKRLAGFTLIEMIIAMVVISVGLAGVLSAFSTVVRSSADPLVNKQALALAEEMMEEVMLKPYAVGAGAIVGCDRRLADDIFDYNGYSETTCAFDGTPAVDALAGYTTTVTVVPTAIGAIPAASASQVTVTVANGVLAPVTLISWRVNWP